MAASPAVAALRFGVAIVAVAAAAALFAIAFRASLTWIYRSLYGAANVVEAIGGLPPWLRLLVPVTAATMAGGLSYLRTSRGQNVSNVMEAIALGRVHLSLRTTASRVLASGIAIAGGMSIGREGPLIETGGALGAAIASRLHVSLRHTRVLVAAGTAAGFAAAYNTPFAAVLFVIETIAGVTAPQLVMPVMAATVIATAMTRAAVGPGPIYGQRAFELPTPGDILLLALLGAVTAVAIAGFKRLLAQFEDRFERWPRHQPWRAALGGLIVGVVAVWMPAVAGNGYETLNQILDQPIGPAALVLLMAAKALTTSASVASGIPGGVFTPVLLIGAALGSTWAALVTASGLATASSGSYALVGMAAATAASIHAPLTAAVMIFELSGDYPIVLPLAATTVVATVVSRALGSVSVYDAELKKRGLGWEFTLEGRREAPRVSGGSA